MKTLYVDVDELDIRIKKSGLKIGYIVDTIGISRQSFDLKRKGKRAFNAAEVFVLCSLLQIDGDDREKIFGKR